MLYENSTKGKSSSHFPWNSKTEALNMSSNIWFTLKHKLLTGFGIEKLGEVCKSIFRKFYSPSNKPSIFSKWLILWRKSSATFMSFAAEIKLSIFSWLSEKISASTSHFLRLKVLFLENYFCDFFHLVFTSWCSWICGEKYDQLLKNVWHEFILASQVEKWT